MLRRSREGEKCGHQTYESLLENAARDFGGFVEDFSKILESGREITTGFRTVEYFEYPKVGEDKQLTWQVKTSAGAEKPLYVVVGFQTDRKDQIDKDATYFDSVALRDAKLFLNAHQIPYEHMDLDFSKDQFGVIYRMFAQFRKNYLGEGDSYVTTSIFKTQCPILIFDATKMPLDMKASPIDVRLEFSFHDAIPDKTAAHALLIYDKIVTYNPFSGVVLWQV